MLTFSHALDTNLTMTKTHHMKLTDNPFKRIQQNQKQIELCLFDHKRQQLKINDLITFSLIDHPQETLTVEIIGLYCSRTFQDLLNTLNKTTLGWTSEDTIDNKLNNIRQFYSIEDEHKYGVIGIHLKLIESNNGSWDL